MLNTWLELKRQNTFRALQENDGVNSQNHQIPPSNKLKDLCWYYATKLVTVQSPACRQYKITLEQTIYI